MFRSDSGPTGQQDVCCSVQVPVYEEFLPSSTTCALLSAVVEPRVRELSPNIFVVAEDSVADTARPYFWCKKCCCPTFFRLCPTFFMIMCKIWQFKAIIPSFRPKIPLFGRFLLLWGWDVCSMKQFLGCSVKPKNRTMEIYRFHKSHLLYYPEYFAVAELWVEES